MSFWSNPHQPTLKLPQTAAWRTLFHSSTQCFTQIGLMPRKQTPSGYNAATWSRSNVHKFPAKPGSSATQAEHIQRSCPLSTKTHTHARTARTHTLTASVSVYTCYPTPHTHSCGKGKVSHLSPKCPSAHAFPQTHNKPSVYRSLLEGSCWMLGLVGAIFLQLLITLFSSGFHAASSWQRNREHWSNAIGDTVALVPVSPWVKTRSDGSDTSRRWDPKACQ